MSKISDPIREYTDLCIFVRANSSQSAGADMLAAAFQVQAWSADFMLILATIYQRIDALQAMIEATELDEDIQATAKSCLKNTRVAFADYGLRNQWQQSVQNYLSDTHLAPLRMLSAYIRISNGYTVPDGEELAELAAEIETLITWLSDIQLTDKDFIRAALIEGLQGFLFRIQRVGFFGWPGTFESLKAVVTAYMALERGMPDPNASPPYEAAVKKVGDFLIKALERVKSTKEVVEVGDWLLRGYGALQAIGHAQPAISGLLTHSS